jgi:hypothetical protein
MANLPSVVFLLALAASVPSATRAEDSPADILRGLNRAPAAAPVTPKAAPTGSVSGNTRAADTSGFDPHGYRQPELMTAFFLGDLARARGGTQEQVQFYIMNLIGTANRACPNVDSRIPNAVLQQKLGPGLKTPDAMARMGWQALGQFVQQLAKPNEMMRDILDSSVWEGDARADMSTFLDRYGCGEEMNAMLRNAVRYFQDPVRASQSPRATTATSQGSAATASTPEQRAALYMSWVADPKIRKALAALPENERPAAAARFEAYKTKLRHAIADYEKVEITPEKAEAILRADKTKPELIAFFVEKVAAYKAAGVSDPAEIAKLAYLQMIVRGDSRSTESKAGVEDYLMYKIYGSEHHGELTEEQRTQAAAAIGLKPDNPDLTMLDYLLKAALVGMILPAYGPMRQEIISDLGNPK